MNINSKIDALFYMYDSFDTSMYIESFIDGADSNIQIFTEKVNILGSIVEGIKKLCQKVIDTISGIIDKVTSGLKGNVQVPKESIQMANQLTGYAADLKKTVSGGPKGIAGKAKDFIKRHPKVTIGATVAAGTAAFVILKPEQFKALNEKRKKAISDIKATMHNIKVGAEFITPEEYDKSMKGKKDKKPTVVDATWTDVTDDSVDLMKNVSDYVKNAQSDTSNYKLI